MKSRAVIPLAIGLIVGLIAVKLSVDVVKKARAGNDDMVSVVVAQQMVPMGVELKPGMLTLSKTGRSLAPPGAAEDPKKLVGRVARTQIAKGMPVIEEMLAAPGTPAGMASLVPSGYRAMAVKVEEDSSVAGFLKPGCRVDVAAIMSIRPSNGPAETISKVILQNIQVGAVGQSLTGESESSTSQYRSVTLLVRPDEVPVLHLAATNGRIRLAMRHYEDEVATGSRIARESDLDPNIPKARDDKDKDGGFLSKMAQLFKPSAASAGRPPVPVPAAPVRERVDQAKPPYIVTLMQGNTVEAVAFADSHSMQRVNPGRMGTGSPAAEAASNRLPAAHRAAVPASPEPAVAVEAEPVMTGPASE